MWPLFGKATFFRKRRHVSNHTYVLSVAACYRKCVSDASKAPMTGHGVAGLRGVALHCRCGKSCEFAGLKSSEFVLLSSFGGCICASHGLHDIA